MFEEIAAGDPGLEPGAVEEMVVDPIALALARCPRCCGDGVDGRGVTFRKTTAEGRLTRTRRTRDNTKKAATLELPFTHVAKIGQSRAGSTGFLKRAKFQGK
jgi:hypothetical protein